MTLKRIAIIAGIIIVVAGGIWWQRKTALAKEAAAEPEMETAKVERKDLQVTVSASGVLEALTTVQVKSRSGGEITRLFVEAGDPVKAGQLIAQIDPTQIKSRVDQAAATVAAGQASTTQARLNAALAQVRTSTDITKSAAAVEAARANVAQLAEQVRQDRETTVSAVQQAEAGLAAAKARLTQAQAQSEAQPRLQQAEVERSKASLESARQNLIKAKAGARPQEIAEAQASVRSAASAVRNAEVTANRQRSLLAKGFVSKQAVDDAEKAYEQAVAQQEMAQQSLALLQAGNRTEDIAAAEAQVSQAEAALRLAQANEVQVQLRNTDVDAAREAVREATASLANAQAQRRSVSVREKQLAASKSALRQAEAALASSRGGKLDDASKRQQVQVAMAELRRQTLQLNEAANELRYTSVYAPRSGVIMEKLVEEGTVIPAGTAALKEGTTMVTIADTSKMFILADVDETDMAGVRMGQQCEITASVLPDQKLDGKVVKIFPLGQVAESVIRFKVRAEITNPPAALRPGMTADITIKVAERKQVLLIPDSAITRSKGKTSVEVLGASGQTETREIKAGLSNWDETEIVEGVKEGETVVIPPPPGSDRENGQKTGGDKKREAERKKGRMIQQFRQPGR
ncbi:MAG: efflux RND transporter periplasmic adaptor subunit [Armatimonadia bacterium]